jgi:hypothetical protein
MFFAVKMASVTISFCHKLNNKMMEKEQKVKINRNYKTQIVKKTKKR